MVQERIPKFVPILTSAISSSRAALTSLFLLFRVEVQDSRCHECTKLMVCVFFFIHYFIQNASHIHRGHGSLFKWGKGPSSVFPLWGNSLPAALKLPLPKGHRVYHMQLPQRVFPHSDVGNLFQPVKGQPSAAKPVSKRPE